MATVFFNLKLTWPAVTDDIRVSIYNPLDLSTPIASLQQNAPHIDQQYSFPGLPRQNFVYKILQTAIGGSTVISQLGEASFVAANDELLYKSPVDIQIGVTEIEGSGGVASTIETNYLGNPAPSTWQFSLKGTILPGATVEVDFTWDNGSGTQTGNVTSTVLSGWSMTDLITDLFNQIHAINVNSLTFTDTDGFPGVRILGLTTAGGSVDITNTTGGASVWPAGELSVTVPGWVGYELIFGRNGVQYPMRKGVDYTWDAMTGLLTLQGEGDSFNDGEWFHAEFETIVRESSGGIGGGGSGSSAAGFSDILLVTANTTLTNDDLTKKILIAPAGNYLEITLPDVDTATANIFTFFEMYGGAAKCAKINAATGQEIIWFNNNDLFICPGESLEIYKRVITPGNNEWRAQNLCGNFFNVGDYVFNDNAEGNVALLDGSLKNYQQYARLYDWVSRNPGAIAYSSWNGTNDFIRVKFSLKESAGSNFRVADLITKPSYLRPGTTTDFVANKLLRHQHIDNSNVASDRSTSAFGYFDSAMSPIGKYTGAGSYYPNMTSRAYKKNDITGLWESIDGDECNPNSRVSKVYVKI
jgi:hypothetical protein